MKNISLSELLKHPEYKQSTAVLPIIIGTDTNDKPFFGKKVEQNIIPLAEKARATGIHLIITSNHFDKISNLFKVYFPVRMAFWVAAKKESVKILGEPGAETLSTQGEALFSDAGRIPILIHTPYMEE